MEHGAEYWDAKHPKIKKLYGGRIVPSKSLLGRTDNRTVNSDVRQFIWSDNWLIQKFLTGKVFKLSLNTIRKLSDDEKLLGIQKWVIKHIHYYGDDKGWGCKEFWQYADETLVLMAGDCEDGSHVIASMLLNAGIESWRVRVTCGWVTGSDGQDGGHAYVTYCRGKDWVPIDWCFNSEYLALDKRTPIKDRPEYGDVWWSTSAMFCWDEKQLPMFSGRVNKYDTGLIR